MLANVFDMLFGCWHKNYSFPITAKRNGSNTGTKGTYVVCLDCGKEFPYDWNKMKVLAAEPEHASSVPLSVESVSSFGKAA